jgi:hypothetical protein
MLAIEQYKAKLAEIEDRDELRRHALKNFSQNISMHNTYRDIINHHIGIEQRLLNSLTE